MEALTSVTACQVQADAIWAPYEIIAKRVSEERALPLGWKGGDGNCPVESVMVTRCLLPFFASKSLTNCDQ